MHITVCICTYKRPGFLKRLLQELDRQETESEFTYSIVVADNDHLQSASPVVSECAMTSSIPIKYCVEPEQNIALARNKAVENASGDYIAIIDDDEFPAKDWLLTLFRACNEYKVDGVLGPVKPFFEQEPPKWLIRGKLCERPAHATGFVLGLGQTRTGNVLFKRQIVNGLQEAFRRQFGNGGEDDDFFRRMMKRGCVFIWCNEAVVHEVVPPERWTRRYLLKKALLRGQNQRRVAKFPSVAKSVLAVCLYAALLPFLLLLGQHVFMRYLIRLLDHAGKLIAILGFKPLGDKYITG